MKKIVWILLSLAVLFTAASLLMSGADETPLIPTASPNESLLDASASPEALSPSFDTAAPFASQTPSPSPSATPAPPSTTKSTDNTTIITTAPATNVPTATPTKVPAATLTEPPTAIPPALPEGTPDFPLTNAQGETKMLSDFLGKPIVLNFWASWCGPCKNELPAFQEAYDLYGKDVTFLLVSLDSNASSAENFLRENGLTLPYWRDASSKGRSAYGVTSIPQTFFLNAKGEIVSKKIGALSKSALINAIKQIR